MAWRRVLPVLLLAVVGMSQLSGCSTDCDTSTSNNVSVEELAEDADVVFVGTPVHEDDSLLGLRTRYVFEVSTIYKGELATEVLVEIDSSDCGVNPFELDIETTVFGRLDEEGVVRPFASRTGFEQQMIDIFGEGVTPTREVELPRPDGLGISNLFGATALLYAGLGLGGLALFTLVGKWVSESRD